MQNLGNRLELEIPITVKKSNPLSKDALPVAQFFTLDRQQTDTERTIRGNSSDVSGNGPGSTLFACGNTARSPISARAGGK